MTNHMVSAASYPPLQKPQERGTQSSGTGKKNRGKARPPARTDSTGTYSPLTDALGSVLALTNSSGNVTTQYGYDPLGNTTSSGGTSTNVFQYTGRENDGNGLYFYRARYYNPAIGRFISEDPIGFAGGPNLYQYAYGSPTNFFDPSGKAPDWNWWATFAKNAADISPEFGDNGCATVFFEAFQEGIVSDVMPQIDGGPDPNEVIDQFGTAVATQYVVQQGLVCAGCSSIYRSIVSGTETAAMGWIAADLWYRDVKGVVAEVTAYRKGKCQ